MKVNSLNFLSYKNLNKPTIKNDQAALENNAQSAKNLGKVSPKLMQVYFGGLSNSDLNNRKNQIDYDAKIFKEDEGDFSNKEYIARDISFVDAEFKGKASFANAKLDAMTIDLGDVKFHDETDFSKSQFEGKEIFFSDSEFKKKADFSGAKLNSPTINYSDAKFKDNLDFSKALLNGRDIYFTDVKFNKKANFADATLKADGDDIDFSSTEFEDTADFSNTVFAANNIDFRYAEFKQGVDFSGAEFNSQVNFENAEFDADKTTFKNAMFRNGANFRDIDDQDLTQFTKGASYIKGTERLFKLPEDVQFWELGMKPVDENSDIDQMLDNYKSLSKDEKQVFDKGITSLNKEPELDTTETAAESLDDLLDQLKELPEDATYERELIKKQINELF